MTSDMPNTSRRSFIAVASASTAAALFAPQKLVSEDHAPAPADPTPPAQPSVMKLQRSDTAVVFIDPQNDVLSEKGLSWPLVHESLKENNTIENMERIFKAAKAQGFEVFISPHYFFPTDKGWKFNGPLETDEATSGLFARKGRLESRRTQRIRGRLAGAIQAVHRRRQNHRRFAAPRMGARDQ